MTLGDLELTVVQEPREHLGYVAGFAITDEMVIAAGGQSNLAPTLLASTNARQFEPRTTPRHLGLRDVLAAGDGLWVCGEYGQLAVSRDHGATWKLFETGTQGCLYALALATDGAIWVVGDDGFAARLLGEQPARIELGTTTRLSTVYAVRDEVVILGFDGRLRRWHDGKTTDVATGATQPLTALAITRAGTWVVTGDGGFVARSPDGVWFSRVSSGVEVDLEAIAALSDGQLIAVGGRGQILISRDDGRSWRGLANQLGLVHLWSVERFGGGALIGGDHGLILRVAPAGDATWSNRAYAFGGGKPGDAVFAGGPAGFIENGLAAYLSLTNTDEEEDDEEEEDDDGEVRAVDKLAFDVLGEPGDAAAFAQIYGVPLPREAAQLFEAAAGHDKRRTFEELRLDNDLRPDVGEHNLFELMVRRNQQAELGTDLVEAFCGVFGVGSQRNGDSYHMEIYEWDGPRQVLHFDHEIHAFSGVFADSLDSLVYLTALVKLGDANTISRGAYDLGIRRLRGKVAPTWQFSIADKDPEFVVLEPKRRDTEFLFFRARWIWALLEHDGVTEIHDVSELFMADLNQVIPADQLLARYEACEKFIPTALYAMWRAYLFDEPELARYLEIGRRHVARLVRDAARLIDELCGGRNQLGTITDVRAWLAEFRALDLDPRRALERKVETEVRAKVDSARKEDVLAVLARTSRTQWSDLAWRWLDDGVAHRALLEQLEGTRGAGQIARLDALRDLAEDDRDAAIARVAGELSPELEAILVGSLVRDDQLAGVLGKPSGRAAGQRTIGDGDDHDDKSPGWEAIDNELRLIYGEAEPLHFGTVLPYVLGGNDPIHGISVYPRIEPVPHWHFITYGFTDLFQKETDDLEESGFGFELTLRLSREIGEQTPPSWSLNFLQNLGRYVFGTGNRFAAGHKMGLNGPIALDHETKITAICFADDPELGDITSVHGRARFVQVVGITDDEYKLIQEWSTTGLLEILASNLPHLVTDLARGSVLDDPATAAEVEHRVAQEGSSEDLTFAGELLLTADDGRVRIEMGALYAAALPRAMRGRIRHGRAYELRGRGSTLQLTPASSVGYQLDGSELVLEITQALGCEIEARLREGLAGSYEFAAWPALEIVVTPSFIRSQDGSVAEVRGIADPVQAQRILDAENARLATASNEDEDEDRIDDDDDDDLDDDDAPDPARVTAALAMTERALRLAPDDTDVQFTHAMLLIDGERAALSGKADELLIWLPRFAPPVRINVAIRMGQRGHDRFEEAVDIALAEAVPERMRSARMTAIGDGAARSSGDVVHELFGELGDVILEHAPVKMTQLVPLLPDDVKLLSELAGKSIEADQRDAALALYDRLVALPMPEDASGRTRYLVAMNHACIQARGARAYDAAVRIADRAQPIAHEDPSIFHAAACAYVAVGELGKALAQVKLAIEHDYDHVLEIEVDPDLGPLLEWPEFEALFRDWHAREEGN